MTRALIIIFVTPFIIQALSVNASAASVIKDVDEGNLLYNDKKYEDAIEKYRRALEARPDSNVIFFNLGNGYYKKGNYKNATESFDKVLSSESKEPTQDIEAKTNYNIGNSIYRKGENLELMKPEKALSFYSRTLECYKRAMDLDPEDEDAKFNYEFVAKKMQSLSNKMKQEKKEEKKEKQKQEQQEQEQKKQGEKGDEQEQDRGAKGEEDKKEKEKDKEQQAQTAKGKEGEEEKKEETQREEQEGNGKEKKEEKAEEEEAKGATGKEEEEKQEDGEKGGDLEFYRPDEPKEMSKQEASMLLESLKGEEVPRKQLKIRRRPPYRPESWKDW